MDITEVESEPGRIRRALAERLGGFPGPFWALWVGTLVNRAGTFIEPFFILYLTGPRHVGISTAGLVLTIWGVGSVLSQGIGGVLADRLGRRMTLAASLTSTAIVLFSLSFARSLVLISALAFVLGIVGDMYRPAASAAIADLIAPAERQRAFALQFWAINLGFSIASMSAGLLLSHFGFGLLFVLDAATTFVFGFVALAFVPETRPDHPDEKPARIADPLRLLAADRLLLVATALVLIYAVLYGQVNILLPLAIRHAGLHASVYGYVISINGVLIVVGQPLTIGWLGRRSQRIVLPVSMAVVGGGIALTVLCHRPWAFAVTVVVWTIGEIGTAGSFQALVSALAPAHMRGRYAGALGLAWGASALLAPLLGASGYAYSPALLGVGCLVAGCVAATGQYWLLGAIARRLAN